MAEFTYPGQYITEKGSGVRLPESVSTSIGCAIGIFPKGDIGAPKLVTSYAEFQNLFYAPQDLNSLRQVKGFFDEGGGSLYVIRVDNDTLAAANAVVIAGELEISAPSKGAWAGSVVSITGQAVATTALSANIDSGNKTHVPVLTTDGFEVGHRIFKSVGTTKTYVGTVIGTTVIDNTIYLVLEEDAAGTPTQGDVIEAAGMSILVKDLAGNVVEQFEKVTFEPTTKGYYKSSINVMSKYIRINEIAESTKKTLYTYVDDNGAVKTYNLTNGNDGTYDVSSFVDAVNDVLPQITTLANVFACLDDVALTDAEKQTIYNAITTQAELSKRYMNLIQVPLTAETISKAGTMGDSNGVVDFRNGLVSSRFAVLYLGHVEAFNEVSKAMDWCPANGHIAGLWARVATNVGYWQVPAGVESNFRTTNNVSWSLTYNQQGVINPKSINAVRFFSGHGLLVWGARTLSNNTDFRYISDSLTFNFIEQTILSSNLWGVFKPNNVNLWRELHISMDTFLTSQWRAGALKGESKSEAFFINSGKSVTTEYDILQGIVNIEIGLATQKPGEFVHYTISPKVNL